MPIYDNKCSKCEHQTEIIKKISDKPKNFVLNVINKRKLKKLIVAPSFRLKGGSWHQTDFKTGSKKNIAISDKRNKDKFKETLKTNSKKGSKQDKIKD